MGERGGRGTDGVDQGSQDRQDVLEDQEWKTTGDRITPRVLQRPNHRLGHSYLQILNLISNILILSHA